MTWIAWKMLTGDRSKYVAIVFGVTFACFLIAEQSATFCGVMRRTTSQIRDTHGADVWVMNPGVRYVDDLKAISDNAVFRVRGVLGVAWAVNLYRGQGQAQLTTGNYQGVILMGVDDSNFAGAPATMVLGKLGDLQDPDAIIVDEAGFRQLWPGEPLSIGKVIEMNDRRAVVVGVFRSSQTFMTLPVVYTRLSQATLFVPPYRRLVPFVLAKCQPGAEPEEVARRIAEQTGLMALTRQGFVNLTMNYYLHHTGIPLNFGTTVLLGFLVGCAIAGQTFYLFTVENLKQFGTLKAMGLSDRGVIGMILVQALVVAGIGYGFGVGLATAYGIVTQKSWPLLA
jgi:putative ABC transport system permease protein